MPCVVPAAALAPDPAVPQQTRARLAQARGLTLGALSPGFAHTAPSADMSPHPHVPAPLGGTCTQKPSCTCLCPDGGLTPLSCHFPPGPKRRPHAPLPPTGLSGSEAGPGLPLLSASRPRLLCPSARRLPRPCSVTVTVTATASRVHLNSHGRGGGDQDTVRCAATRGGDSLLSTPSVLFLLTLCHFGKVTFHSHEFFSYL